MHGGSGVDVGDQFVDGQDRKVASTICSLLTIIPALQMQGLLPLP
jgi:hypothetical protein